MNDLDDFKRLTLGVTSRRTLLRGAVLGGAGLAAAALIGCGDDDDDDDDGGGGGGGTATPTATEAPAAGPFRPQSLDEVLYTKNAGLADAQPKMGGILTDRAGVTFPSIDPVVNAAFDPPTWHGMASSTLLAHSAEPGVTHFEEPIVGDLADSWELTPDGLTFIAQINGAAVWNDRPPANGRSVEARDVVFTFERYKAEGLLAPKFELFSNMEAVSASEVKLTFAQPIPEVFDLIAFEFHPIMNPEYLDSVGGDIGNGSTEYVGSGPFMVTDWEPRVKASWVRNPTYFGKDKFGNQLPYLDGVEWLWIDDASARGAAFDANDIDDVAIGDRGLFGNYTAREDVYVTKGGTSAGQLIVALNHRNKPFDDSRVRRAISMAIDRPLLDEQIYGGVSDPALPLPPRSVGRSGFPTYEELPPTYQLNPSEAKKELMAAGQEDLDIGPLFYWFLNQSWEDQALLVQSMLADIGVKATPMKIDRSPFLGSLFEGNWEGALMQHSTNPGVSNQAWAEWAHSEASNNFWGVDDPEIDSIVEELRVTLDDDERLDLLKRFQDRDTDQAHRPYVNQLSGLTAHRTYVINPSASAFLTAKRYSQKFTWLDK